MENEFIFLGAIRVAAVTAEAAAARTSVAGVLASKQSKASITGQTTCGRVGRYRRYGVMMEPEESPTACGRPGVVSLRAIESKLFLGSYRRNPRSPSQPKSLGRVVMWRNQMIGNQASLSGVVWF